MNSKPLTRSSTILRNSTNLSSIPLLHPLTTIIPSQTTKTPTFSQTNPSKGSLSPPLNPPVLTNLEETYFQVIQFSKLSSNGGHFKNFKISKNLSIKILIENIKKKDQNRNNS